MPTQAVENSLQTFLVPAVIRPSGKTFVCEQKQQQKTTNKITNKQTNKQNKLFAGIRHLEIIKF